MTLRSKLGTCLILLCMSGVFVVGAERPELYRRGNDAYEQGNYVVALKELYAFYVLNEELMSEHEEFKKDLEARIARCEQYLTGGSTIIIRSLRGEGVVDIPPNERRGEVERDLRRLFRRIFR